MPAQWTAFIISEMHLNHITQKQLAGCLGVTPEYVSMVLNGHREPIGAEERFRTAVAFLVKQHSESNMCSDQKSGL